MITAAAYVTVFHRILDGATPWRCGGCRHPYRARRDEVHGACPVCGWWRTDSEACTAEVYRASRADDAPVPFAGAAGAL